MTHKYHKEGLDAQKEIKSAGFPVTLVQTGARTGGEDYNPTFGDETETIIYALDISDDLRFRQVSRGTVKAEKMLMVSAEYITADNPLNSGDVILIRPTDKFPELPNQSFQVVEVEALAPAGVPIFYTLMLSGKRDG